MPADEPDDSPPDPADRSDEPAEARTERGERGDRGERGERADRGDRSERAERGDRGDRGDRGEKGDREGDRLSETIRARLEHLVPELVRKTFTAGLGAVYSTEEGIRKIAKDINLPDVAGYLASSADATKDRVMEVVARETREFLEHINLGEEIAKLLTTLSFEIKTEIRFIPNSDRFIGSEPDVKASVRLKRAGADDDGKGEKAEKEGRGEKGERGEKGDKGEKGERGERGDKEGGSRLRFWRRDDDGGEDKS